MPDVSPLLVFDLDGTLAETAGDLMAALNVIMANEGLPAIAVSQARMLLGAGGRALIERGFASAGRNVEKPRLEELFRDFLATYNAHICVHSHLFAGVPAALDALEAEGFRFAICTNKVEASAIALMTALGVRDRFPVITGQDTFPMHKPDPRALLLTIERAGGLPGDSIMIGDSVTDIATAQAAKVPVIAVDFGYTDKPVSDLGPDVVISHFDQLAAAVAQIRADRRRA